mgnify:CR=1 FL=1
MVFVQFNYTKVGWLFLYIFSDKIIFCVLQIRFFSTFAAFCSGLQRMDSGGGRCYDNARCESVIVIMKEEMFYSHKENLLSLIHISAPTRRS